MVATPTEFPDFQFRGCFTPAYVLHAIQRREISSREHLLLCMIDSLVRQDGTGCYASNGYLARIMGVTPQHVVDSLTKLVKLKLVRRAFGPRNRRFLWADWSIKDADWPEVLYRCTGTDSTRTPPTDRFRTRRIGIKKKKSCTPAVAGRAASKSEGSDMVFRPELISNHAATDINPRYAALARRMAAALSAASRLGRKPGESTVRRWAVQIRQLAGNIGDDRTGRVVEWVIANAPRMGQAGVPNVTSVEKLRRDKVLSWVEDLIKKEQKSKPREVSPEAETVATTLMKTLAWPKGSKTQLPGLVEDSIRAATRYYKRVRKLDRAIARRFPRRDGLISSHEVSVTAFRDLVLSKFSGGVNGFVERWWVRVNKRVQDWKAWSGDLAHFSFSPTSKEFDRLGREWATEYAGSSGVRLWETFEGLLDEKPNPKGA